MKRLLIISLLLAGTLSGAQSLRKEAGDCFLEPLEARDSVLVADQLRYGFRLENVPEGTPLALPELKFEKDAPMEVLGSWQLDSVRVSKRKETPARYDIRASLLLTTWMGGSYTLPDIPILFDGDTLVFKAPAEPLEVTELPVDMESFQAHDIKDQVKFPYTLAELFPWIYGSVMLLLALTALILYLVYREKKTEDVRQAEPAHIRALETGTAEELLFRCHRRPARIHRLPLRRGSPGNDHGRDFPRSQGQRHSRRPVSGNERTL